MEKNCRYDCVISAWSAEAVPEELGKKKKRLNVAAHFNQPFYVQS